MFDELDAAAAHLVANALGAEGMRFMAGKDGGRGKQEL